MSRIARFCGAVVVAFSIATTASAATYSATASVGRIDDIDLLPPVASLFDFGQAVVGTVVSAILTADPCDIGGACNDTLGTGEFYVFDFSGDIQTTGAAILPLGTPFDTAFNFTAATLADLADGLLAFTVGCDDNALLNACTGIVASDFTLTIETDMTPIPLPASAPLLLLGMAGIAAIRRRA